jgi:hypothetical protein
MHRVPFCEALRRWFCETGMEFVVVAPIRSPSKSTARSSQQGPFEECCRKDAHQCGKVIDLLAYCTFTALGVGVRRKKLLENAFFLLAKRNGAKSDVMGEP